MKTNSPISASRSITTSVAVSLSDVTLNAIIAAITGSTVMFAQALQGLADVVTASLLLIGVRSSKRSASADHPFGYGREVFFWTLLASIFALLITAGLAIISGVRQIISASSIDSVWLAIGMLTFGLMTNAYSLNVSLQRLRQQKSRMPLWRYLLHSSLVETKTSLLVDAMGTLSALIGLIALSLFQVTGNSVFDGLGAVSVGALTAIGSGFLVFNLRGFIVGQSPPQELVERIRKTALAVEGINDVLDLRAIMIGSGQVLAILELHFADDLTTDDIEKITDKVKAAVIKQNPSVKQVQVEAETPDSELKHPIS